MAVPITLSTKLDHALQQCKPSHRAAIKSACLTVCAAIREEQNVYESPETERIAFEDRILRMVHKISHFMQDV